MPPRRAWTLDHEHSAADAERRIRLLSNLAGALAELGLTEEALEACKAIARLRDGLADAGADPAVERMALRLIEA
jgi:hypothetical protein